MKTITQSDILSSLSRDGLPFRDTLSETLGPLIREIHPEHRERVFSPEVVVFLMLAQALDKRGSLKNAVIRNNAERTRIGLKVSSVNTSSYSDARQRLNVDVLKASTLKIATEIEKQIHDEWKWKGFIPKAIDGTTLTANDTLENQTAYPQNPAQKQHLGFPIMRVVVLQSLATGMIINATSDRYIGKDTGEASLARRILPNLNSNDLLLGDRYYPSFFLIAWLTKNRVAGVFQSHGSRKIDFRKGQSQRKRDHICTWFRPKKPHWMSEEEYEKIPQTLTVRETDVSKEIHSKKPFVIVTTLLDQDSYTKKDLGELYSRRWEIELALRDLKTTMGLEHINANTPEMIEKELWAHLLAYNALRWQIANAAKLVHREVSTISVSTAKQVILNNETNIRTVKPRLLTELRAAIFFQMSQCAVHNRLGRKEPRKIKRRQKPRILLTVSRSQWKQIHVA